MKCMVPCCDKEATTVCPDRFGGSNRVELHFCEEDYAKHYYFDHVLQACERPPGPTPTLAIFHGNHSQREWVKRRGSLAAMTRS